MALQTRKSNRLKTFNYSNAGLYFITVCVEDHKNLLCDIVGGGALDAPQINLSDIGKIVEKYIISTNNISDLSVVKYIIMPNHIHLVLGVIKPFGTSKAPSPTNEIIPHSISTFKRFVNRDVGRNVFQRSFYDHIIRNEGELNRIVKYIDANPSMWILNKHNDSEFYNSLDNHF